MGRPLVGRDRELALVRSRLASGGRPRGVGLFGEAGVGKTRLLAEVVEARQRQGGHIELVHATEAARAIPLGSFAHLLQPDDQAHRPDELLHLALVRLRERAGGPAGFLLAIDDAHLLDDVSVAVLHLALTQLHIPAVLTVRTGEPVPDGLLRLWKDDLLQRHDLDPLSRADTEALVVAVLGDEIPASLLHRISALSGGNPLFTRELILATPSPTTGGTPPGAALSATDRKPPPARLRDLVDQRLRSLDTPRREALELLALAEQLPLPVADRLLGPEAIAELEAQGLAGIVLSRSGEPPSAPGSDRRLEVAHPLYREVLVASLPDARRRALLRRLIDALAAEPGFDRLRLARWRLDTGTPGPAAQMVALAREALGRFDHPLAERLARTVGTDADSRERVGAGLALGEALAGQARLAEADEVLAGLTPETPAEVAEVAIARADHLFLRLHRSAEALGVLQAASEALTSHPGWQSECRSVLAQHLWFAIRLDEGGRLAEELLARPDLPATARVRASSVAATTRCARGRLDDGLALLDDELFALAARHRRIVPYGDIQLRMARYLALYWSGRVDELDAYSRADLGVEVEYPPPSLRGILAGFRGGALLLQGRAQAAVAELAWASRALAEADWFGQRPLAEAMRSRAALFAGDLGQAGEALATAEAALAADPLAGARSVPYIELTRAWLQAADGAVGPAAERCRELGDALSDVAKPLAVEAYHTAVRLGWADTVADDLVRLADEVDGPMAELAADHARARVQADGDALTRVSDGFAAAGALLPAAEACRSAANAFGAGGRGASAAAAGRRSDELLGRCGPVRSPGLEPRHPVGEPLTGREREVAMLAATGRSSAAIADELVVSVRTVDTHLYRAYRKLMVSGRDELPLALGIGGDGRPQTV